MSAPAAAMDLPLAGVRMVEASAGTGKTFTIATLYLRLILEQGLAIDEIVVATFTRAAATELGMRLRERLLLSESLLRNAAPATPRADDDGATRETRTLIERALADASIGTLRTRITEARLAIDTAFIGTLHGFCHRVLADYGFETGQALAAPELVEDLRELEKEIVRDFWRRGSADPATALLLVDGWGSPEALAAQLHDSRWRDRAIEVPVPDAEALRARFRAARQRIARWDEPTLQAALAGLRDCVSHAPTLKKRREALSELHAWAAGTAEDDPANAAAVAHAGTLCAKALDAVQPKGVHASGAAFDDIEALCAADSAIVQAPDAAAGLPAANLLRDARAFLAAERTRRLAERNLMGHDEAVDRLAAALAEPRRGAIAVARIRARWKAALVDEFQDTDKRQWQVLRVLFGDSTLVLVGDPKQAIYGFRGGDVFAWLDAREQALRSGAPLRLRDSYRAGAGLCHAVNALFSRPHAFIEAGIEHPDVESARPQRAVLHDGVALPALQLWWLDPDAVGHAANRTIPAKTHAQPAIQRACVGWIKAMLQPGHAQLRCERGALAPLRPRHIAVLVDTNEQAAAMQAALGRAGVPAASNLRASVFASEEAADLALLLEALAAPDDARRARAALASLLLGVDAAAIAASSADEALQARTLERTAAWSAEVQRQGPLPWLHALLQDAAPRLLALPDGERRTANYLQLAELLQDLHTQCFGLDDLAARFARARVGDGQDAEGDAARLRLDTDADAVTVATVHAAKGLEFPVVLVPYAVLARDPAGNRAGRPALHWYHDEARAGHVAIGAGTSADTIERARRETRAEEIRKFYVAITRAAALCVLPYGPTTATQFSAPFHLLHQAGREAGQGFDAGIEGCKAALRALCDRAGGAAECVDLPAPAPRPAGPGCAPEEDLRPRAFARRGIERDWQVWSFSRLARGSSNQAAADPLPGAGDQDTSPSAERGPGGAAFGTAVHSVFEQADFAAWRDADAIPDGERARIDAALRAQGLTTNDGADPRAAELTGACVRAALNTTLPCGARLCDVAPMQRRAEIEFHLSLAPARSGELMALLHAHGYQRQRGGVAPEHLCGLLTGKIDLTFAHAGRFHIVDWKTNRCAPYDDAALRGEIAAHDYDLQWLIYTLALHRWLRQQVRDYDYDRHVGEVYYLFVRGMRDGAGVHVDRPPRALVEAMDGLFTGDGRQP